jgi:hypothetical protein
MFERLNRFFDGRHGLNVALASEQEANGGRETFAKKEPLDLNMMLSTYREAVVKEQATQAQRREICQALLETTLYIPMPMSDREIPKELYTRDLPGCGSGVLAFTDLALTEQFLELDYDFTPIGCRALCERILAQGTDCLVLNLYTEASLTLESKDVRYLAQGQAPPPWQGTTRDKEAMEPNPGISPPAAANWVELDVSDVMCDFTLPQFNAAQLEMILNRIALVESQNTEGNPEALRMTLYFALLKSHVLIPLIDGDQTTSLGWQLRVLVDADNALILPAYTSHEAAYSHQPMAYDTWEYPSCPFWWVAQLAERYNLEGIVLHTPSQQQLLINPQEFKVLAEQQLPGNQ